jgi:hypothetical protein
MNGKGFAAGAVTTAFTCIGAGSARRRSSGPRPIAKSAGEASAGTPWPLAKDLAGPCRTEKTVPGIAKSRANARKRCGASGLECLRHGRPSQYSLRGTALANGGRSPDCEPVPLRRGRGRSEPKWRLAGYPICAGLARGRLAEHWEQEQEAPGEAPCARGRCSSSSFSFGCGY